MCMLSVCGKLQNQLLIHLSQPLRQSVYKIYSVGKAVWSKYVDLQILAFLNYIIVQRIITCQNGMRNITSVCFPYGINFVNIVLCYVSRLAFDKNKLLITVQQNVNLVFYTFLTIFCKLENNTLPCLGRIWLFAAPNTCLLGNQSFPPSAFKIKETSVFPVQLKESFPASHNL